MSQEVILQSEDFKVEESEEDEDGLVVTGVAMPLGKASRNRVFYTPDSVEEASDTMEGKPVLMNHDTELIPRGRVEEVNIADEKLHYRMNVNEEFEKLASAVRRGDMSHVSIQAFVEQVDNHDYDVDEDVEVVEIKEFVELSFVNVPGFPQTTVDSEVMTIDEMVSTEDDDREERINRDIPYDDAVKTSWDGVDVEEFPDFEAFASVHAYWEVDDPETAEDVDLPVAHYEDEQYKIVYEALQSAWDLAPQTVPDDEVEDVREYLETLREEAFPNEDPLEAESNINGSEQDNTMSDEDSIEAFSDLSEQDFYDFIASHYEGMDPADVGEVLEGEFTGVDEREVASLIAEAMDVSTDEVLDMFEQMMESDDEEEESLEDRVEVLEEAVSDIKETVNEMVDEADESDEEEEDQESETDQESEDTESSKQDFDYEDEASKPDKITGFPDL